MLGELGVEASNGRLNRIVVGLGKIVASQDMQQTMTTLSSFVVAGGLKPTVNAVATLVASGTLNATFKPVIDSAMTLNFGQLNFSGFATFPKATLDTFVNKLGDLPTQPIEDAARAVLQSQEFSGLQAPFNALLSKRITSLAALKEPEFLQALNTFIEVCTQMLSHPCGAHEMHMQEVGKVIVAPTVRNLVTAAGNMVSAGHFGPMMTALGPVLKEVATRAPQSGPIFDVLKPVADAAIVAMGSAIDTGRLDPVIKAMTAMGNTKQSAAVGVAVRALVQRPGSAEALRSELDNMRKSKSMVRTKSVVDAAVAYAIGTYLFHVGRTWVSACLKTLCADVLVRMTRVRSIKLQGGKLELSTNSVEAMHRQDVRIYHGGHYLHSRSSSPVPVFPFQPVCALRESAVYEGCKGQPRTAHGQYTHGH